MDSSTIFLSVFFCAWIGWAIFSMYKKWSGTIAIGGGFLVACLSLLAAIPAENMMASINQHKDTVEKTSTPSLGITPDEFKARFNKLSEEIDAPFHVNRLTIERGAVDTFKVEFDKNHVIFGTTNKDGLIDGATSISAGDGTMQSGLLMMQISDIIVKTFSPQLSKEDAGKIVLEMMQQNTKSPGQETNTRLVGNVEYFTSLSKQIGFWFGAQVPRKK